MFQMDPYGSAANAPSPLKRQMAQQKIPLLSEALAQVDGVVIVVHEAGVRAEHPFSANYTQTIAATISSSKFSAKKVVITSISSLVL